MIYVEDLIEEINQMRPIKFLDEEYFDNKSDPAWNVIESIMSRVPNIYKDDLALFDVEIATNGDEFLFNTKFDCE